MMLRIGSSRRAFTLIEVMMAAAVLALGTVLIYQVYFMLLDTFDYCKNYFSAVPFVEEKIWQAQDELARYDSLTSTESNGAFGVGGRNFPWRLSSSPIGEAKDMRLHQVNMNLTLSSGKRRLDISRIGFASYEKNKN